MDQGFACIEGNLALSMDVCLSEPSSAPAARRARIYEFPCRRVVPGSVIASSSVPAVCPQTLRASAPVASGFKAPRSVSKVRPKVLGACAVALVIAFMVLAINVPLQSAARISRASETAARETVIVRGGDSLWNLAERHGIDGLTTDQTVEVIRSWNTLATSMLTPGDEIVVPAISD